MDILWTKAKKKGTPNTWRAFFFVLNFPFKGKILNLLCRLEGLSDISPFGGTASGEGGEGLILEAFGY